MNVWINLTPAHCNQRVSIPQARTDATVSLVGEIRVLIAALILTNVLRDLTDVLPIQGAPIHKAHTDVTAYLVGGTAVIILVLMLMNVPRDGTAVQPTHIALTRKAHTDAIATAVSTDLETDVIMIAAWKLSITTLLLIPPIQLITLRAVVFWDWRDAEDQRENGRQKVYEQAVKFGSPTVSGQAVPARRICFVEKEIP